MLASLLALGLMVSLASACGDATNEETNNTVSNNGGDNNNVDPNDCSEFEVLDADVGAAVTLDGCYHVEDTVTVSDEGHLTIMPGSILLFAENTGLDVRGKLTAEGTADAGILFAGQEDPAGYWRGIRFGGTISGDNQLIYVTIDGGGSDQSFSDVEPSNLGLGQWNAETKITLKNSTLRNSGGWGAYARDNANFTEFENNTITANASGAMMIAPQVVGDLDDASDYTGNTRDIVEIPGGTLNEAATWKGINVPYYVTDNLAVSEDDSDLVIEPGATFKFDENVGLEIRASATLNAVGTAENPITFEGDESTAGYWRGIRFGGTTSAQNELNYVVIDGGGSDNAFSDVESSNLGLGQWNAETQISLKNSTLRNSAAWGAYGRDNTNFTEFENNTITANALGAMMIAPQVVGDLDDVSDYTGNTRDIVEIPGGTLSEAATWKGINVPYYVSDNLAVSEDGTSLVIEPGAVFQFNEQVGMEIRANATLSAVGTAESKIVFEGEEPTPGYWRGIRFGGTTSAQNELTHVVVDGGGSDNAFSDVDPSNVGLGQWNAATSISITDTELTNSGGAALYVRDNASLTECSGLSISAADITGDGASAAVSSCGL
jgi:hypothetical protein